MLAFHDHLRLALLALPLAIRSTGGSEGAGSRKDTRTSTGGAAEGASAQPLSSAQRLTAEGVRS